MTNREFVYWIQGYFELAKPTALTTGHLTTIMDHIKLVRKVDGKLDEFTGWLEGILEAISADVSPHMTNRIKERLADKFKHEIDPTYLSKKDQAGLNKIHSPSDPTVYRC